MVRTAPVGLLCPISAACSKRRQHSMPRHSDGGSKIFRSGTSIGSSPGNGSECTAIRAGGTTSSSPPGRRQREPSPGQGITGSAMRMGTYSASQRVYGSSWIESPGAPKPGKFGRDMDLETAERVRVGELKPLPSLNEPKQIGRVKAGYYDIDVHNHVNNVRYLTWMLGGLGKGFSEKHEIRELEINFLSEGFSAMISISCKALMPKPAAMP
jgi:hypothetical protein